MRWPLKVFAMELRRILAYRSDFWINFVGQTFFSIIIAYFLWKSIFDVTGKQELNGFTMDKMIIYYLLAPLVFRIQQGETIGAISREIYEGSLNKFLLYPVNFFLFKIVTHFAASSFYLIQIFLIILAQQIFFPSAQGLSITLATPFYFCAAMLVTGIVYFFLNSLAELIAFWAEYIWSLGVILRFAVSFLGGALIPLAFFPTWALETLKYTPFPYMISFPLDILFGNVTLETFAQNVFILLSWGLLFLGLSQWLWHVGKKKYSGVGI